MNTARIVILSIAMGAAAHIGYGTTDLIAAKFDISLSQDAVSRSAGRIARGSLSQRELQRKHSQAQRDRNFIAALSPRGAVLIATKIPDQINTKFILANDTGALTNARLLVTDNADVTERTAT